MKIDLILQSRPVSHLPLTIAILSIHAPSGPEMNTGERMKHPRTPKISFLLSAAGHAIANISRPGLPRLD